MEPNEYTPELYTLADEDGNEMDFEMLDQMEIDGVLYYAMIPYYEAPEDMLDNDGQLVVLRSEIVDGEELLATIDDEAEYDRIGAIFIERLDGVWEELDDET